jgi:hypothetical protein
MTPQGINAPNSQRPATGPQINNLGIKAQDGCEGGDISKADEGSGCCAGGEGDISQAGNGVRSNDEEAGRCIRVTPRSVTFTSSNPGPFTVTVHVRNHPRGTVSESDNCGGASGIATVTLLSGNQWTVAAGAQMGSCVAVFTLKNAGGQTVGRARLHITNTI